MNFKTTYWLFGILVAVLLVAAVSLMTGPKAGDEGLLLAKLRAQNVTAKDITRVTVERKQPTEQKLVFVRIDKDRWKLEEPYPAQVDGSMVERIVSDLLGARKETKGADLTSNLSHFGLDNPPLTVTLFKGDNDPVASVSMGNLTFGDAANALVYVVTSEQPKQPAAVRRSTLGDLFRDVPNAANAAELMRSVSDFRPKELLLERVFNAADVVRTVDIKGGNVELKLNKTSAGTWQYEKPAGYGDADVEGDTLATSTQPTAPTGVKPLLSTLSAIRAGTPDDFIENVTDFKQYGLEPGKEAGPRVEVVRDNPAGKDSPPITEVLTVGKKEEKGNLVYVRPGSEAVVVKVPDSQVEPLRLLLQRPGVMRDRTLLNVAAAGVDAVDIQVGADAPIELRRVAEGAGNVWKIYGGPDGQPKNANAQVVTSLVNELAGRGLVKEHPEPNTPDATLGFDHPSATMTVWVGGILPEEKKPEEKKPEEKKAEEKKDAGKAEGKAEGKAAEKKDEKKEEPKAAPKPKMKEPTVKLIFGKRDKDLLYVRRIAGNTKADLAVPESLLGKVTRGRLEYLDVTLPSFTTDKATKLAFNRGDEQYIVEKQQKDEKSPATWVFQQPSSLAGRTADFVKVQQLLGALSGLRAERLWAEKATDRELERFGLKPPRLQATVSLKDDKDKERVYQFGTETDDKQQVYAKLGGQDLVFSARKGVIDPFQQTDLIDPTVFRLDLAKVTGMKLTGWKDVVGQETALDLERKGANNWSVKAPAGYKLSASQAEAFLTNLAVVRAEKFVAYKSGPKPEYKLTTAAGALQVDLTIDGEKEPTTLTIGGPDPEGKHYYAQSNKLPGDVFLVAKDRFEKYKSRPGVFAAE